MTIRAKFAAFTSAVTLSAVALGMAGIWAINEVTALQRTASAGIASISELRRMDTLYKELLTTYNLALTFRSWVNAFDNYERTNREFIESPRIKSFLQDPEFKDIYDIAMTVMNANLRRVEELKAKFLLKIADGTIGERGLMVQAFAERREGAFFFQMEVSEASAHFGEMTGKITQQLVEAIEKRTREMQAFIVAAFVVVIVAMAVAIFVFAFVFSTRIGSHIKMVEKAVSLLSTGDVSHTLQIRSNDEFGLLSRHYNEFVADFKNRLAAGLDFIRDMRETVTSDLDLRNAYRVITRSSVKDTYADAGALFALDRASGGLRAECVHGFFPPMGRVDTPNGQDKEELSRLFKETIYPRGENMPGRILESGESLFVRDNYEAKDLPFNAEEGSFSISSLIAVPFLVGGKVFAVLMVAKTGKGALFTDMDFIHMQTFADYAALMLDNMIQYIEILEKRETDRDISIASEIQQRLLPKNLPTFSGAELGAFADGARGVSGDYHDFVKLDEDRLACVICDVSGKGVAAAFIMVMIRTILRIIIGRVKGTAALLKWINSGLMDKTGLDRFATMAICILDARTGKAAYSNAAHLPLLRYRAADASFEQIDTDGLPLGVERKAEYEEAEFDAEPGDLLVLFSDGVTELKNEDGEMFGLEALKRSLSAHAAEGAAEIAAAVRADLSRFMGGAKRFDDTTFLVLKVRARRGAAAGL